MHPLPQLSSYRIEAAPLALYSMIHELHTISSSLDPASIPKHRHITVYKLDPISLKKYRLVLPICHVLSTPFPSTPEDEAQNL